MKINSKIKVIAVAAALASVSTNLVFADTFDPKTQTVAEQDVTPPANIKPDIPFAQLNESLAKAMGMRQEIGQEHKGTVKTLGQNPVTGQPYFVFTYGMPPFLITRTDLGKNDRWCNALIANSQHGLFEACHWPDYKHLGGWIEEDAYVNKNGTVATQTIEWPMGHDF